MSDDKTTQLKDDRPADPARRRVTARLAQTAAVGGAVVVGAVALYDPKRPVRRKPTKLRTVSDHRVEASTDTPSLVIARGKDPTKNVEAALQKVGGLGPFVGKDDVVVVKPNVGWDRKAAQAANTNPDVVAAVVRPCVAAGAREVIVTDNPVNDPERCFSRSGILEAVQQAGGKVAIPQASGFHMVAIPGKLGRWPVFEPFLRATRVINVPIVKHHSLTKATLGMKNWYGILGGRRNQLHQRIDDSVAELAALMRPTLTVMDATRVLMRNGPTGGSLADVKRMDTVAVSLDPVAVDAWACTLLGADPTRLNWLKLGEAKKLGVVDHASLNPITLTTG